MTKSGITFKAQNLEGESVYEHDRGADFTITFNNGTCSATHEFFGGIDCFKDLGQSLKQFLSNKDDIIHFDANGWKCDMSLKIYRFDINGHSCIQVNIEDHKDIPAKCKLEFYIATTPVKLNQLGELLYEWDPKLCNEICWEAL